MSLFDACPPASHDGVAYSPTQIDINSTSLSPATSERTPLYHDEPSYRTWTLRLLVFCGEEAKGLGKQDDEVLGFPTVSDDSTVFIFSEQWITDCLACHRFVDLREYIMHAPKSFDHEKDMIDFSSISCPTSDNQQNPDTSRIRSKNRLKLKQENAPVLRDVKPFDLPQGGMSLPAAGPSRQRAVARDIPHHNSKNIRPIRGEAPRNAHDRQVIDRLDRGPRTHPYRPLFSPDPDLHRRSLEEDALPIRSQAQRNGRSPTADTISNRTNSKPLFERRSTKHTPGTQFSPYPAEMRCRLPLSPEETPRSKPISMEEALHTARDTKERQEREEAHRRIKEEEERKRKEACRRINERFGLGLSEQGIMVLGKAKRRSKNHEKDYVKGSSEQEAEMGGRREVQWEAIQEEGSSWVDRNYPDAMVSSHASTSSRSTADLKSSQIKQFLSDLIKAETRPSSPLVDGPFITPPSNRSLPAKPYINIHTDLSERSTSGRRIKYMIEVQDEHGSRRIEVVFPKGQERTLGSRRLS